jgi:hypothetical protein
MLTIGFFGTLGLVAIVLSKQGILRDAKLLERRFQPVAWTAEGVVYKMR